MWPLSKKGIFETGRVLFLPVDAIQPNPNQPRRAFTQPELEELANRVVTMYQGRINAEFQKADINQDNLTAAAFGIVKQEAKEA